MRTKINKQKCPPLLLCDFYKTVHSEQYNPNITKIVSYFTPRMSRIANENELIIFGLQAFIREYLIDYFDENFFNRPKEEVVNEYNRYLKYTLGEGTYKIDKVEALYDLGYLPLEIKAIPEGTRVPIKVPMIEISNTHPDFAWVTNAIESLMSCSLWHTMISANVGYKYREIVNKYYDISVEDSIPRNRALGDFSMRGQESLESAVSSASAFCLSFLNTATVPTITYLENNYYCNIENEDVIFGSPSTEHSVMCSNTAIDGDEITFIKKLLTEIYPNNSFSMVSDSYDYWNVITNLLPKCKEEILNHNGKFIVRPDSGNPIDIVCGTQIKTDNNSTPEELGTVECLWNIFGGTINSKGFKVLDSHIRVIYGDGITLNRAEEIYKRLIAKGFSCENVTFGVGSFSMQCLEESNGVLSPFTRDTFSIAVKATYCELDGEPIMIFKNPKTDKDNFKKSQKGCCLVYYDEEGNLRYKDELTFSDVQDNPDNQLITVFKNSEMIKEYSLSEIRNRLWNGKF